MNDNSEFQRLVEEVKEKADIVGIIGQYIHLEKKGTNYVGLCPFHDDKNPSLSVSPAKHIYKCFSCNASGNVITFVQNFKNISFMDALREVASTVGISVAMSNREKEELKNKKFYDITHDANEYYKFYLFNAIEGDEALKYLNNRQLSEDVIKRFNIGLSGSGENDLYKTFKDKHLPIDMVSVGLLREYENKYFDVFKKRIIFPIENLDGKIVGFSGRRYLPGDEDSKYVNTNETVIFKKGQILYNYSKAIQEIKSKGCVYLFEGFMDVIAAYRAGVYNCVASMGTALTVDQIKALKRVCDTIIVCYDGDAPGVEATKRAIAMLMQNDCNVRVVSMPDELDPDEYINANGADALKSYLLNNTISGMDFYYSKAKNDLKVDDISSIESFKKTIFGYLHIFKSNVIREMFFKRLSEDLGVSVEALVSDFNNTNADPVSFVMQEKPKQTTFRQYTKQTAYPEKYLNAERELLYIAYSHIDKSPEIVKKLDNSSVDEKNSLLINKLYQLHMTDLSIQTEEDIQSHLNNDEKVLIMALLNEIPECPSITKIDLLCDTVKENVTMQRFYSLSNKEEKTQDDYNEMIRLKKILAKKGNK